MCHRHVDAALCVGEAPCRRADHLRSKAHMKEGGRVQATHTL